MRVRSTICLLSFYFGFALFSGCVAVEAQTRIALKSGESVELREYYYIINCQSVLLGTPVLEVLEGPEELILTLKEGMRLPRAQKCAKQVPGGTVVATAKEVKEPIEAKLTIRLKFNTKVGERQGSNAYTVSLFP